MQFPSGSFTERVVTDATDDLTNYTITNQLGTLYSGYGDLDMLKKLAAVSSQLNVGKVADKVVSASISSCLFNAISFFNYIYEFISLELAFSNVLCTNLQKSQSEMLVSVHHISLVRTADCVSCSLVMDKSSYVVCIFISMPFCFILIR